MRLPPKKRGIPVPNFTYKNYNEYLATPEFRAVRQMVMLEHSRCCRCGAKATQVHHIVYPPWGWLDVPENLVPVCYWCHCVIEKKVP